MANALYPTFKEGLIGGGGMNLDSDTIHASLLDGADEAYAATDNTYVAGANGIADASKVATVALANTTVALGVFDTDNFTWSAVTGDQSEVVLLWDNTVAAPIADRLMAWYDTGMTGMPVTPNSGDINGTVHGSGWFAL